MTEAQEAEIYQLEMQLQQLQRENSELREEAEAWRTAAQTDNGTLYSSLYTEAKAEVERLDREKGWPGAGEGEGAALHPLER